MTQPRNRWIISDTYESIIAPEGTPMTVPSWTSRRESDAHIFDRKCQDLGKKVAADMATTIPFVSFNECLEIMRKNKLAAHGEITRARGAMVIQGAIMTALRNRRNAK